MFILNEPTQKEITFSSELRNEVKRRIDVKQLDEDEVAERLNLLPSGVEALLSKKNWPIDTAMRVASALDVEIMIDVRKE